MLRNALFIEYFSNDSSRRKYRKPDGEKEGDRMEKKRKEEIEKKGVPDGEKRGPDAEYTGSRMEKKRGPEAEKEGSPDGEKEGDRKEK